MKFLIIFVLQYRKKPSYICDLNHHQKYNLLNHSFGKDRFSLEDNLFDWILDSLSHQDVRKWKTSSPTRTTALTGSLLSNFVASLLPCWNGSLQMFVASLQLLARAEIWTLFELFPIASFSISDPNLTLMRNDVKWKFLYEKKYPTKVLYFSIPSNCVQQR